MFCGPYFILSIIQAGTTPISKVFGMTGLSTHPGPRWVKLDLNAGYHQIELHTDSCYITIFLTHTGLKCYKRLNFVICFAAEVFQYCIQTAHG